MQAACYFDNSFISICITRKLQNPVCPASRDIRIVNLRRKLGAVDGVISVTHPGEEWQGILPVAQQAIPLKNLGRTFRNGRDSVIVTKQIHKTSEKCGEIYPSPFLYMRILWVDALYAEVVDGGTSQVCLYVAYFFHCNSLSP